MSFIYKHYTLSLYTILYYYICLRKRRVTSVTVLQIWLDEVKMATGRQTQHQKDTLQGKLQHPNPITSKTKEETGTNLAKVWRELSNPDLGMIFIDGKINIALHNKLNKRTARLISDHKKSLLWFARAQRIEWRTDPRRDRKYWLPLFGVRNCKVDSWWSGELPNVTDSLRAAGKAIRNAAEQCEVHLHCDYASGDVSLHCDIVPNPRVIAQLREHTQSEILGAMMHIDAHAARQKKRISVRL